MASTDCSNRSPDFQTLSTLRGLFEAGAYQSDLGLLLYHGRHECWAADKQRFSSDLAWNFRALSEFYSSAFRGKVPLDRETFLNPNPKDDFCAVQVAGDPGAALRFLHRAGTAGMPWAREFGDPGFATLFWVQALFLNLPDATRWVVVSWPGRGWAAHLIGMSPDLASVLLIDKLLGSGPNNGAPGDTPKAKRKRGGQTRSDTKADKRIADAWATGPEEQAAHSIDFRSVRWFGVSYSFTAKQAPVVRLLFESFQAETPDVGDETLLAAVDPEAPPARLSTLFRDHPAWGTIILPGGSKGTHRLAKPVEEDL